MTIITKINNIGIPNTDDDAKKMATIEMKNTIANSLLPIDDGKQEPGANTSNLIPNILGEGSDISLGDTCSESDS